MLLADTTGVNGVYFDYRNVGSTTNYNPDLNVGANGLCANIATSRYWSVVKSGGDKLKSFVWTGSENNLNNMNVPTPEGIEVVPAFSVLLLFTGSSIEIRDQDSLSTIT